jgi:hypothetical protein
MIAVGNVRRAHLCLRKFDGSPLVAYVLDKDTGYVLMVGGNEVATVAPRHRLSLHHSQPTIGLRDETR